MRLAILLTLVTPLAFAQSPAQTPQKGSIEGQVVNAATGEPLRKATVMLRSSDGRRSSTYGGTTDAGGNFTLKDLEKGSYRLSVERTGFVRSEYGGRGSSGAGRGPGGGAAITLDAGQKITGLVMKMSPQAVITGRVLDVDGDPVIHASVNVLRYSYQRGKRQLVPSGGASTDDQGEYRIHSLQPGKYYVSATWQMGGMFLMNGGRGGPAEMRDPAEDGYAPTYYPRTTDVASAVALDAGPGAVLRNIDILLTKVRTVQISGKLIDPEGGSGRNLSVMIIPRDGSNMMGGRGAQVQDGKFVIRGVRSGSYTLVAERWEGNKRMTARMPIEVGDSPLEGLSLVLSAGLTVNGTIKVEGDSPAQLSSVSVLLNDAAMGGSTGGRTKGDGTFSISNAAAGVYTVTVLGIPENCYLKSIRFGDEDALANGLNLARGAGSSVDIVLSPSAGSVEAVVLDAKQQPATGVYVVAVPEGARADSQQYYKMGVTDPYGRASLKGLAPGDYKLYAWEGVEANAWQDPDFRKQYERSGESISIRENGRESKQLTVLTGGDGARP
jgi:protocatechuate 3,4-dioxygenase beta subunit